MHFDRMIYGVLTGLLCYILVYAIFRNKPFFNRMSVFKKIVASCLFMYIGAVLFLTQIFILPSNINLSASGIKLALRSMILVPFESSIEIYHNGLRIGDISDFYRLIGGNFIMLMPLAILVPLLKPNFGFVKMSFLALGVSVAIEGLQLFSNVMMGAICRTVEIDDLILNVSGCIVAYLIFSLAKFIYNIIFKNNRGSKA